MPKRENYNTLKLKNVPDSQFKEFIENSSCWYDVAVKCGMQSNCKNRVSIDYYHLKRRTARLNIACGHLSRKHNNQCVRMKLKTDQLVNKRRHTRDLRKMLQKAERLYICEWCRCDGMELWNGEWTWRDWPLKLQIDHKNGIKTDDSVDNLRYLCPNCHSQTGNFGGKANHRTHVS